jgi:hypothetical protein
MIELLAEDSPELRAQLAKWVDPKVIEQLVDQNVQTVSDGYFSVQRGNELMLSQLDRWQNLRVQVLGRGAIAYDESVDTYDEEGVAVRDHGRILMPTFQFDKNNRVLPAVTEVNTAIREGRTMPNGWMEAGFWTAGRKSLDGLSPSDLLSQNPPIEELAQLALTALTPHDL